MGTLLSGLVKGVLEFVWSKLVILLQWGFEKLHALVQKARRHKKIDDEADQSVEPLKKAKTAKEIDEATDAAHDGF